MKNTTVMEFHVSRRARDRYDFDESIFSFNGNVIFADYRAARVFAQKINEKRDLVKYPEQAVKPGQITAMGLIDEALHYVVSQYRREVDKDAIKGALEALYETLGKDAVDNTLRTFADEFPIVAVYRGEITLETYLEGVTEGTPNREIVLEEMLLLWLANMNPAFSPFTELFDDATLRKTTSYPHIISGLRSYFDTKQPFGPDRQHLVDMLRSPAIKSPYSLSGQLEYIRERWGIILKNLLRRIPKALDLFKEEEKTTFTGPGRAQILKFGEAAAGFGYEAEAEEFSPDREWMPELILIAKNVYVWLDQLSKKYSESITSLDEIPDEELDTLRRQGFSGLWLIGVWERSSSSQKIKQLCGNPEAVPSAYSLYDYVIAADLGGEEAYSNLRDRAWTRGIRLASDMVPNHVGIYSKWTVEHPDWFVSLDYNPFPWYTFNGMDLSHDERVGIFVEDHYYNCSDAAVVFKRLDRWTGDESYVYHGNDGTSMPWNDTAQLNYLNPEVREAMIRTILHVARKFPVIRFDAAMTLTKKHYQRLWFPEPGTGGAIPTRAEFGLTREEFNEAMPKEFWREVVDRVAAEAPDTLLLAEAFWLLEGYFVRSLGMHRVYNSAFMNMLRDEENAGYRQVMKNTLEFDPEILRRFVNFMNNPDERTAVDQFGKDGKYFGSCIVMITMPGLPMFGHGQIEGFTEKYGMEYRRAYREESPDPYLMERHEREIFPLLHLRHLFAGVEHFLLYDFFTPGGNVNEDVYAYSNRLGGERALVAFHNKFGDTAGWIRTSVAYSVKRGEGDARDLVQKTLGEGLGLPSGADCFTIFRDHVSGLRFVRENRQIHEKGLYVELGAYGYHVFLDFQEIVDNEWRHYSRLAAYLDGRGVPDMEKALKEMLLQPVLHCFREVVNVELFRRLRETAMGLPGVKEQELLAPLMGEIEEKVLRLLQEIKRHGNGPGNETDIMQCTRRKLESLLFLSSLPQEGKGRPKADFPAEDAEYLCLNPKDNPASFYTYLAWVLVHALGGILTGNQESPEEGRRLIDEWFLGPVITETFEGLGLDRQLALRATTLVELLVRHCETLEAPDATNLRDRLALLFSDEETTQFLQVNEYRQVLWFSRDSFQELLVSLLTVQAIKLNGKKSVDAGRDPADLDKYHALVEALCKSSERSGYRVVRFLEIVKDEMES